MAYDQLEPFGEERADFRAAIIAQILATVHRGKGQRKPKLSDFMPNFDRTPKQQAPEQIKAVFMAFAQSQNQRVAKGK